MRTELSDAVLTALNDVALDNGISDDELINLIAENLGRLIVHASDGEPERLEHLVGMTIRNISGAIRETAGVSEEPFTPARD